MEVIYFLWVVGALAIVGIIYNYIQLKREEREDNELAK